MAVTPITISDTELEGNLKNVYTDIRNELLPISTPFVGLVLGAILKWLGASHMTWIDMAEAGAMAVMIRESWNQIVNQGKPTPHGNGLPDQNPL